MAFKNPLQCKNIVYAGSLKPVRSSNNIISNIDFNLSFIILEYTLHTVFNKHTPL